MGARVLMTGPVDHLLTKKRSVITWTAEAECQQALILVFFVFFP
jgi:hypothetical protein